MRVQAQWAVAVVVAVILLAGCGGSDPETVDGCAIEPATSCPAVNLTDADLEGADLSGAVLTNATLAGTNLSDANLTGADLSGAQITDADFSDADLTDARLTGATITGTNFDEATFCGTVRTDGTIDDTSCPGDSTDETGTETETDTDATGDEATVTSLEVTELDCGSSTIGQVTVSWETENATAVEIALDTEAPTGFSSEGETNVDVPCDGEPHAVTVTPQSDAGPGVPDTQEISTSG